MMTPEERYTRMENLMHSVVEMQAHLTGRQDKLAEQQEKFAEQQQKLAERQEKHQVLIEQDRAAIRDLIAINRTVVESQQETATKLNQVSENIRLLWETGREHKERLNALIDIVDRIIRRDHPPS
jgi:hypothetical protein